MYVCMHVCIYIYMTNSLSYDVKKENCLSRNSKCDRQAVYILGAGTVVTQGPSPLYRDKTGPRDSQDVCVCVCVQ